MRFWELLKIEFMKVKRSKIISLIFIAPLLVVCSGVENLSMYFTPEYTNAWPAMFILCADVFSFYGNGSAFGLLYCCRMGSNCHIRDYGDNATALFNEMVPCAVLIFVLALLLAAKRFGKKEMSA